MIGILKKSRDPGIFRDPAGAWSAGYHEDDSDNHDPHDEDGDWGGWMSGWKIVNKSKLKISQSCSRCLVSKVNHLAAIIGRDLSDYHDSCDADGDDKDLVAIMGTFLSGGVSWLEEECRDRSETKWITEARLVCSCSTWKMVMVTVMMVRILVWMKSYTSSHNRK